MLAVTNGEVWISHEWRHYLATYRMEGGLVVIVARGACIRMAPGSLPPETAAKLVLGGWIEEGSVHAEQDCAASDPEVPR